MRHIYYRLKLIAASIGRRFSLFAYLLVLISKLNDARKGGGLSREIRDAITKNGFTPSKKLEDDIWKAVNINLVVPMEYFSFEFYKKTDKQRAEYIGDKEKKYACTILNRNTPWRIFEDKWQTYCKFKDFFKRECILISSEQDKDSLVSFLKKHGKIILKERHGTKGRNIYILQSMEELENFFNNVFPQIKKEFIAEEYIHQEDALSKLNPTSVNTIRMATFLDGDKTMRLFSFLRIGRNGMIIDNASANGVLTPIDVNTGICRHNFFSKWGGQFEKHPDHGYEIKGFQIPNWQDLLAMIDKLTRIVPEQRYVCWDIALTDKGYELIEANSQGQVAAIQIARGEGFRKTAEQTWYKYL